ncbi:carboxylesterase/lipase family protein [Alkalihalobacillus sp. LMS39]|uniref:carboxylesterase/lipase family protein n=1 Tax=Alkalihalobacillus sp. LMS39 TaxID=2924032 RepID=UPI001FB1F149|nr:carboxylesterase/lipase family protein [Alkalihalobacillus sp. LMS39]UOE94530.1 carboxylesterase/lipase family protein [Alkalihalobacillus sp. LMS39]
MSDTTVESAYGKLQGVKEEGVYAWKGIPYAKPPLESLRFQAPEKPERWSGIRDATTFSPVAVQPDLEVMNFLGNDSSTQSEDCLYLNVWSPGADDKRRPVMVWIHGGAFVAGSGSGQFYDGTAFAKNGDVVVVTLNYRLGILGFLHLGEIGGVDYATSGNCGLLDQVAALEWVQENVAMFGGDPSNVTVFGESAGAMSIGVLLAFPSAKGLFHKAILQSGAAANVHSVDHASKIASQLVTALNIDTSELSKLQHIPAEQLVQASTLVPFMSLGPVIDGISLLKHPEEALAEGVAKDIPILIGTNKDEYNLFSAFDPEWKEADEEKIKANFEKVFGPLVPLISQYLTENAQLSQDLFNQLLTMSVFTTPAQKLAEIQVKQESSIWMYRFDWETPVFNGILKATHALEIPFVWNTLNKPTVENITGTNPNRQKLAKDMHHRWISFAHDGNPNSEAMPEWPTYDLEQRSTMIFNEESIVAHDPNKKERLLWEQASKLMKMG